MQERDSNRFRRKLAAFAAAASAVTLAAGLCLAGDGREGGKQDEGPREENGRTVRARRTANSGIKVDGVLDELDWKDAEATTGFTQQQPHDGDPATERTDVRVVYDDDALYVGIKAYDTDPAGIKHRLCRRDEDAPSDWLFVIIDSYNDKRTGFCFAVNPCGVKRDLLFYNDSDEDGNWDAVWSTGTRIDGDGWTAEFCIPFSQLRFANNGGEQRWGFQVARHINRKEETSFWSPNPRGQSRMVSRFGSLEGLRDIPAARNLEILPYSVGSVSSYGDAEGDPFRENAAGDGRFGADVKYQLTNNMTLNMTLNPDFGQVEQDPSEFNLTAYETYFEEKRPFFVEGANLFRFRLMFGDNDTERLFYSRRIGRQPSFYPLDSSRFSEDTDDFHEDSPEFTKILGAAKITGRTANGWSIGIMNALTDKEEAEVQNLRGERLGVAVEPLTNYFAGRALRDFNDGRSTVGVIATSVLRDIPSDDLEFLNRQAYTGGFDFTHRFLENKWWIDVSVVGSHVRGSEEAMLELQTSSARYYQRPDADHLGVDSTLTHMEGTAAKLWFGKFAGEPWRFGVGYRMRTPGFECNDLGYMRQADDNLFVFWAGYREFEPGRLFREYSLNLNMYDGTNWGGERYGLGGNINGWFQFLNYWAIWGGIERDSESSSTGLLRGGPSVTTPGSYYSWYGFDSDYRKAVSFGYGGNSWRSEEGHGGHYFSPYITIRPSSRFDIRLNPSYEDSDSDMQYVDEIDGRYIISYIRRKTFSMTTRLNFTVNPEMSIQLYAMPYLSAGEYSDFREVVDPHAADYDSRFAPYDYPDDPDFNFKQLRSNLVFRWEYSPGSTVYLVWSRGATNFEEEFGRFDFDRDVDRLFSTSGDNTFLIKINKWFSI